MVDVPPHLKHYPNGSIARRKYGCDCRLCLPRGPWDPEARQDHAARQRKLRESKKGKPVPPGTKHGIYARKVYGCTCSICSTAKWRTNHRANNPWMYRPTHGRWVEENGTTRLCWPPAGAAPDWKCPCQKQQEEAA
jgi:hypothetical protein